MSQCQIELMNDGKPYPRSCMLCGLGGKCRKGLTPNTPGKDAPKPDYGMTSLVGVADALCELDAITQGEIKELRVIVPTPPEATDGRNPWKRPVITLNGAKRIIELHQKYLAGPVMRDITEHRGGSGGPMPTEVTLA